VTNPKESGSRIKVGPHNTIGVAMEDLPKVERRTFKMELEEEMAEVRRRKLKCFQKICTGDQENRPGHHDYDNRYIYGNS
jgi:hypothetical protein